MSSRCTCGQVGSNRPSRSSVRAAARSSARPWPRCSSVTPPPSSTDCSKWTSGPRRWRRRRIATVLSTVTRSTSYSEPWLISSTSSVRVRRATRVASRIWRPQPPDIWRMPTADITRLYRAGLVHGLGRLGVSNQIWEKKGPLSTAERERVRMYPYLTGRILSRVGGLESVVSVATKHEERVDGSGFPRGARWRGVDRTGPFARRGGLLSPIARAASAMARARSSGCCQSAATGGARRTS